VLALGQPVQTSALAEHLADHAPQTELAFSSGVQSAREMRPGTRGAWTRQPVLFDFSVPAAVGTCGSG
jgi:hypothetical protein